MNEDMIAMEDFQNICRLCLQSTGTLSNIFTACAGKSLQKQILCITGLAIKNGDGLPSKICHRCRHIVDQASELRDVVEKSHKILEKAVLDNIKQGSDTEPFDNETFLQSLSDLDVNQEKVKTEKIQDDSFENDVCNESEILPVAPSNELNAKCVTEDQDHLTEIAAAEVPSTQVSQKSPTALVCQICLTEFASKEEVRPHVEQHYVGTNLQIYLDLYCAPYLCTICDQIQLNKAQLVNHHRRHLSINPFMCKESGCKYVGKNMDGLRRHMVLHSVSRRSSAVVSHVTHAQPRAAHACGTCGLHTGNEPALQMHMRAHHSVPEYVCPREACARSFPSLRQLHDHELTHCRYRCHLCNADHFTSISAVRRHVEDTHAFARMITCAKCPATFEEHAVYYRHWLAHHGPWAPHRCRACNQGYPTESHLLNHERTCERLKNLLSIITEHTHARTGAGDSDHAGELSGDDLLNGEIEELDEMELGDETNYGD